MFKSVSMQLNSVLVTQPTMYYGLQNYLISLLGYGGEGKLATLSSGLYYKDTAYCFDFSTPG